MEDIEKLKAFYAQKLFIFSYYSLFSELSLNYGSFKHIDNLSPEGEYIKLIFFFSSRDKHPIFGMP